MNLNPFIDLFATVISLYSWILIIHIILSWLVSFNIINPYQPFVKKVQYALFRLTEPLLKPVRKYMPDLGGLDISPIVVFLVLGFLKNALYTYLYSY